MSTPNSKLLKLKTDLKSLKYSQDLPGGGDSGQPFVRSPLPDFASPEQLNRYEQIRSGIDNPIRLGATTFDNETVPFNAPIDRDRIAAQLRFTSRGRLFGKKQKSLQVQNPKMEGGVQGALGGIRGGELEYTRIYKEDNSNLLQQIGRQGSGFHLDRAGNLSVTPYQSKYAYMVPRKPKEENRLVVLHNTKILERVFWTKDDTTLGIINKLGISRQRNNLFEYVGGPQGQGPNDYTVLQRYDYTNTWKDVKLFGLSGSRYDLYATGSDNTNTGSYFLRRDRLVDYALNSLYPGSTRYIPFGTPISTPADLPAGITHNGNNKLIIRRQDDTGKWYSFSNSNAILGDYITSGSAILGIWQKLASLQSQPGKRLSAPILPVDFVGNPSHSLAQTIYSTSSFVDNNSVAFINRASTLTYAQIKAKGSSLGGQILIQEDFRKELDPATNTSTEGYSGVTGEGMLATKYGIGNPGFKGTITTPKIDYSVVGTGSSALGVDLINALDVGSNYPNDVKDLVKCRFVAVEGQQTGEVFFQNLVFRAFITDFSDNYNASYNEHQYVGRGEKFYTYNVGDRKIGFTLTIAPQSRVEMRPIYRKLNYLVSQIYPAYSDFSSPTGNGFMRAPLMKLTIGDYVSDQPGFITAIGITVPNDSPWETVEDPNGKDKGMYQLPHVLNLAVQFTPIHNFLARRSFGVGSTASNYKITPFITPNTSDNKFAING
jgi:hypothetical protein